MHSILKAVADSPLHLRRGDHGTDTCDLARDRESSRKSMLTHGHTAIDGRKSPTYESWRGMLTRCKKSYVHREWYADRGITVAPEWRGRTGFVAFLEQMGERPEGMTLDRIDPDGNYEPGNCRWATLSVQAMNKRPRARLSEIARLERLVAEPAAEIARLTQLVQRRELQRAYAVSDESWSDDGSGPTGF